MPVSFRKKKKKLRIGSIWLSNCLTCTFSFIFQFFHFRSRIWEREWSERVSVRAEMLMRRAELSAFFLLKMKRDLTTQKIGWKRKPRRWTYYTLYGSILDSPWFHQKRSRWTKNNDLSLGFQWQRRKKNLWLKFFIHSLTRKLSDRMCVNCI